ncbi:MAG: Gfo/Idh/MocA family oxidoreductase [Candidatus Firestonebacteria bacterium]
MRKVRLGLVGITNHARGHGKIVESLKNVEIIAGCDISPAGREKGKEWYGLEIYGSLTEMLKNEKLDAVIISTPNFTHRALAVECLKAGLKVLCEKPMAHTLADCKKMTEAVKKYKGFLQIGFELKTCPIMLEIKKIVKSGSVGELKNIHFLQTPGPKGKNWKVKQALSGGLFIEKLCHQIDTFRYFLGDMKSAEVYHAPNTIAHYDIMDNCYATFGFKNGSVAHISFITGLGSVKENIKEEDYPKYGHGLRFDFLGTKGSISYNYWEKSLTVNKLVKKKGGAWRPEQVSKKIYKAVSAASLYENLIFQDKDFIDRVQKGKKEMFTAFDSYKTMQAAFACEKSAEKNKRIML